MSLSNGARVRVDDPDSRYNGSMGIITQNEYGDYFKVYVYESGETVRLKQKNLTTAAPNNAKIKHGEMEGV
ncbi:hypothetical protein ACEU6E_06690 [Halorutilales archaeon Cl-col2-1]|nr:hypothetical protein [Halobacteria archaeon]